MTTKLEHLANLRKHDWSYMMSDDGNVYRRGSAEATALKTAEHYNPELAGMYNSYHSWWWNDRSKGHPEPTFPDPEPVAGEHQEVLDAIDAANSGESDGA